MAAFQKFSWSIAVVCAIVSISVARAQTPTGLTWHADLQSAMKLASETNRLVLVHFGAPWCQPCQRLEKQVFSQPGFGQSLEQRYVAVKLNFDDHKQLAAQLSVQAIPADVILTPQGQVVQRTQSPGRSEDYVAQLERIADYARSASANPASLASPPIIASGAPAATQPQTASRPTDYRQARYESPAHAPVAATASNPPINTSAPTAAGRVSMMSAAPPTQNPPIAPAVSQPIASTPPSDPRLPAGSPPLGLEGFCPVLLSEQRVWQPGDPRWGAIHRNRTYLFSGEAQQKQFLANPDHYSPVMSGDDPVLAIDEGSNIAGSRRHGVFFGQRIYLFRDDASLERFSKNPNRYAAEIMQAMRY